MTSLLSRRQLGKAAALGVVSSLGGFYAWPQRAAAQNNFNFNVNADTYLGRLAQFVPARGVAIDKRR